MKRRERTRHLIELGGLVIKAKLDELTKDDRTVLYGAFLTLVTTLTSPDGTETIELWRRRGKRAFDTEAQEGAARQEDAHRAYERRRR
ncbi:conjugal transfer protein TraD [Asticcacaulis sp. 201]|uniref:conjugal transfer protein TraD n=1 Tax=Asticcacaulis sp. 201 TaxID=3028787 RepID=UPI0029167369|nr:conjugal transfer protein TraD [Asticcacaulis sp. 201]MDV6333071.1 conjugal transfer protein TraD [Asticcacaulis sp. 201]